MVFAPMHLAPVVVRYKAQQPPIEGLLTACQVGSLLSSFAVCLHGYYFGKDESSLFLSSDHGGDDWPYEPLIMGDRFLVQYGLRGLSALEVVLFRGGMLIGGQFRSHEVNNTTTAVIDRQIAGAHYVLCRYPCRMEEHHFIPWFHH